jgi:hydrogenase expression/formation protein HypD
MQNVFVSYASVWRGFGLIPKSGLGLRKAFSTWDAVEKFRIDSDIAYEMPKGCRCSEVVRGTIYPQECPLFNTECTTLNPIGPCAVSREGACFIAMRYSGVDIRDNK